MTEAAATQPTRVEDVPWEDCYLQAGRNPRLEREMRRVYGVVPLHARYFADCPWVCLTRAEIEQVLRDLASPRLTPIEAVAVPFARETIWYRPARIQRRAREVHARLTGPQVLDLIGTTALGNLLCRLGPVLHAGG